MSVFSFIANAPLPIVVRVTGNTATTIADATNNTIFVPWLQVNEHNGTSQTLTVDLYDGTNATYLASDDGVVWSAEAAFPKGSAFFTKGIVIPKGSKLRVTSGSASGLFHAVGVYVNVTG